MESVQLRTVAIIRKWKVGSVYRDKEKKVWLMMMNSLLSILKEVQYILFSSLESGIKWGQFIVQI